MSGNTVLIHSVRLNNFLSFSYKDLVDFINQFLDLSLSMLKWLLDVFVSPNQLDSKNATYILTEDFTKDFSIFLCIISFNFSV